MCSCSVLFSYSEIPAFEINSPEEVEVINDNNHEIKFQERFNAAKELIWVLPSHYENYGAEAIWFQMDTIIAHFKSLGLPIRYVNAKYVDAGAGFTGSIPGDIEDYKSLLSITNKKFYTYSSLIVVPSLYTANGGYEVCWKLTFHDLYQNLYYYRVVSYPALKGLFDVKGKKVNKALKKSINEMLPNMYTYKENYEYIRPGYTTNWTESVFKEYAQKNGLETFEGIYQIENQRYFVKKHNHLYYLVACGKAYLYLEGDIKGILTPTATENVFLGGWNDGSQDDPYKNSTYAFTDIGVEFQSGNTRRMLIKVWPTSNDELLNSSKTWTGSAWSLNDGYVVTNHHVVEKAKSIFINVADKKYEAVVKAVDKTNDLAVLYVDELKGKTIPYSIKTSMCSVGEKCFVLGYPMSSELGHEIKMTDGIISSRVGYQDNVALYQISAPVQPGNSGCPMFDESGNIVGVVNSGVPSADNVGYAIKLSYLRTLLENYDWLNLLPDSKEVESLGTLTEKVNTLKQYVYLVECSN